MPNTETATGFAHLLVPLPTSAADIAVKSADSLLSTQSQPRRSEAVLAVLTGVGMPLSARLGYRPQPAPSVSVAAGAYPWHGINGPEDDLDLSMSHLVLDSIPILGRMETLQALKQLFECISKVPHVLSYLDAYSCLPSWAHTPVTMASVNMVRSLMTTVQKKKDELMASSNAGTDLRARLFKCTFFTFYQRLLFYCGRMEGRSLDDMKTVQARTRAFLGLPDNWCVETELHALRSLLQAESNRLSEAFHEEVQFEWVGKPIPVEDISTPMADTGDENCAVCRFDISSSGVRTNPCKHPFCKDCLETWIHAAEKASHTCPICRAELFPKPEYRLKEPEVATNYQQQMIALEGSERQVSRTTDSWKWLAEELALQETWEQEGRSKA